jgi:hypothetical protein
VPSLSSEAAALSFTSVTAQRARLRMLVARYDPVEPEVLCAIVAEVSRELPF